MSSCKKKNKTKKLCFFLFALEMLSYIFFLSLEEIIPNKIVMSVVLESVSDNNQKGGFSHTSLLLLSF